MALEFKDPEIKQQRLKILVFGEMGSGKSTIGCSFPNAAYFDTEDIGSKLIFATALQKAGSKIISTIDMDKMISQVKELISTKNSFKTIVIDSLSVAYENAMQEGERKVGSEFGRHIAYADNKTKQLTNLLLRADMNCVITCQSKREYADGMKVLGNTYVGFKRLGYIFDLVLETAVLGKQFTATVRKSRFKSFQTGEEVKFTYEEIIKKCEEEISLHDPIPLTLATQEQVKEANRLVELLNIAEDVKGKWLIKESVETFDEMETKAIQKYIDAMLKRIEEK